MIVLNYTWSTFNKHSIVNFNDHEFTLIEYHEAWKFFKCYACGMKLAVSNIRTEFRIQTRPVNKRARYEYVEVNNLVNCNEYIVQNIIE